MLKLVTNPERERQRITEDIVERLEDLLEQAREGKFAGIAVAVTHWDGQVTTTFSNSNDQFRLLQAISHLKHRMHRHIDDEN